MVQSVKRYEITYSQRKEIMDNISSTLKAKEEIIFAYIHGSFLENLFRDVDLAIYLDEMLSKKEALHFELSLERELEEEIIFPVDVRTLEYSPLHFRFNVFKSGKLLFSKDEEVRSDFLSLSLVEHHDFNFYRKRYRRETLGIEI